MTKLRNARFWTLINGSPVRLTLRPGQEIAHRTGGGTDEGYWSEQSVWTHEGDHVQFECDTSARDCDGHMDRSEVGRCNLDQLAVVAFPDESVPYPAWTWGRGRQRDYSAEAMGY